MIKRVSVFLLLGVSSVCIGQPKTPYQPSAQPQYITNSTGQTVARIDSNGYITNTRGQTTGRIDSQGYITNTRGQTVGRISR